MGCCFWQRPFFLWANLWSDAKAGKTADTVLEQLAPELEEKKKIRLSALPSGEAMEKVYIPDYILNPEMEMPEEEIDG